MTATERLLPASPASQAGRTRSLRAELLHGVTAGAAAILAMFILCAAGLALAGAAGVGSLLPMTAAAVALAAGGRVDFAVSVNGRGGPVLGGLTGELDLMPLGATVGGALVLAIVLLAPYGKREPSAPAGLAARAAGAIAGYLALLAVAVSAGHGTVTRAAGGAPTPTTSPRGGGPFDGNRFPAGGLPPSLRPGGNGTGGGARDLGNLLSDGRVLSYDTAAGASLLRGLLLVLVLLAVCWAAARASYAPTGWAWVRGALRPAVSAVATVVLTVTAAGMALGAGVALVRPNSSQALGALLLGWPNAFLVGWTSGLGVPWTIDAAGVFGSKLPTGAGSVLPGGVHEWPKPLLDPSTMESGQATLLVVAAMALTLACGVLTAVWTRRAAPPPPASVATPIPSSGPMLMLRRAVVPAVALGGVLAVAMPLVVLAAGASGSIGVTVFTFSVTAVTLQLSGALWQAALSGLFGGAAAGLVGAALVGAAAHILRRRPAR